MLHARHRHDRLLGTGSQAAEAAGGLLGRSDVAVMSEFMSQQAWVSNPLSDPYYDCVVHWIGHQ